MSCTSQRTPTNFAFLGRKDTVYEALARFDDFTQRGKSLDAILLTESGNRHERPTGIITIYDMPNLIDAVAVRPRSIDKPLTSK